MFEGIYPEGRWTLREFVRLEVSGSIITFCYPCSHLGNKNGCPGLIMRLMFFRDIDHNISNII